MEIERLSLMKSGSLVGELVRKIRRLRNQYETERNEAKEKLNRPQQSQKPSHGPEPTTQPRYYNYNRQYSRGGSPRGGKKHQRPGTYPRRYLSHLVGKPTMWFPNRPDTNQPGQS